MKKLFLWMFISFGISAMDSGPNRSDHILDSERMMMICEVPMLIRSHNAECGDTAIIFCNTCKEKRGDWFERIKKAEKIAAQLPWDEHEQEMKLITHKMMVKALKYCVQETTLFEMAELTPDETDFFETMLLPNLDKAGRHGLRVVMGLESIDDATDDESDDESEPELLAHRRKKVKKRVKKTVWRRKRSGDRRPLLAHR